VTTCASRWPAGCTPGQHGHGRPPRTLADGFYAGPSLDQFFAVSAADGRSPRVLQPYLDAGAATWQASGNAAWLAGYTAHAWGASPAHARGAFRGPFHASRAAPAALVVGTTYDPATPYEDAQALTRQLGNARLLTMDGDGHGAYGGESPCIDGFVETYLETGALPPRGQRCRQR
jgi:hypothetical protein